MAQYSLTAEKTVKNFTEVIYLFSRDEEMGSHSN